MRETRQRSLLVVFKLPSSPFVLHFIPCGANVRPDSIFLSRLQSPNREVCVDQCMVQYWEFKNKGRKGHRHADFTRHNVKTGLGIIAHRRNESLRVVDKIQGKNN
jgi:hypothetical protein